METSFSNAIYDNEDGKRHRQPSVRTKAETRVVQWIRKNITRKKIPDNNKNEPAIEIPTDGFGQVEFKGATRRAKAKFVRLSDDTPSETIFTLLTKIWKMEQPQLLISVTGGAKIFNMDPKLKQMFATGLRRVAQTPGTWVITGGTNTGVMKHVGEALQGVTKALIGIATWGIITKRESLVTNNTEQPLGGNFTYTVASSLVSKGAFLDHNHTQFLLVDDGSENKFGKEIFLKAGLEKYVMESCERVPAVLLVLEGGPNTLINVFEACNGDIPVPVVVIKGSGRAADLLSYAWAIEEELSKEKDKAHEGLVKNIIECFPDMNTEEKLWDMYLKVYSCMQRKEFITIFQMSGDADVDEAILSAVLKTHPTSPFKQLQLALYWNRADLAQSLILNRIVEWGEHDLEKSMIMALALDRVEFVKLLLNNCVSINEILSQHLLEFLYGYRSRMSQSSIRFETLDKEYTQYVDAYYSDTLNTLCKHENIDPTMASLTFSAIQRLIRLFCRRFITFGNDSGFEIHGRRKMYEEPIVEFYYPYRELFLWAVLNNMHEMALFLWSLEEESMAKAIIGAEINNKLALQAQKREVAEELRKKFIENASDFRATALSILDGCFSSNEYNTGNLLSEELTLFPGHTCLSLASRSKFEEFIAHSSVQQLLNVTWTGALKLREVSARYIIMAIMFPPLIFSFQFRSTREIEKMAVVDYLDDDSIDDDLGHDGPTPNDTVRSISNGSNTQLMESGKTLKSYDSIPGERKQAPVDEKQPSFWKKVFIFYFRIPMVKFYTNVMAYFVFLCLFAYVAMLKKNDTTPGVPEIILIVFAVSLTFEELHQLFQRSETSSGFKIITEHFSSIWNVIDFIAIALFFTGLGLRLNSSYIQYGHLIYAIDAWVWILRLLHYFYAHRILGPYVLMIGKMFIDMIYFFSILVVFLVSYGVLTNSILEPQTSIKKMLESIFFHPYFNIYGELFIDRDAEAGKTRFGTPTINDYAEPITWFFLGFYLLIANVLLLNLLIAIFGNTFTEVQEKSDQIWKFERYDLIVEYALRPSLVPPFIILEHIFIFFRWLYRRCYECYKGTQASSMGSIYANVSAAEREKLAEFQMEVVATYVRKKREQNEDNELMSRIDDLTSAVQELQDRVNSKEK